MRLFLIGKFAVFFLATVLLTDPVLAAERPQLSLLGVHAAFPTDEFYLNQLNTQIFAVFGGLPGFEARAFSSIPAHPRLLEEFRIRCRQLNANTNTAIEPILVGKIRLDPVRIRDLHRSFGVLFVELPAFSVQPIEGKSGFLAEIDLLVGIFNPRSGLTTRITALTARASNDSRHTAVSDCVTSVGGELTRRIASHALFKTESEVVGVDGNNAIIRNTESFTPGEGSEYMVYRQTRYSDGYVDETPLGLLRVSRRLDDARLQSRAIFGRLPEPGDHVRLLDQLGLSFDLSFRLARFGVPRGSLSSPTNAQLVQGPEEILPGFAFQFSGETGYASRFFLDASYLWGEELSVWQGMLGFGWDIYLQRSFVWNFSFSGLFRLINTSLGMMQEGSGPERPLTARSFNPGLGISSSLRFMLTRELQFKIDIGYQIFLPIATDAWTCLLDGESRPQYLPSSSVETINVSGALTGLAFSYRL